MTHPLFLCAGKTPKGSDADAQIQHVTQRFDYSEPNKDDLDSLLLSLKEAPLPKRSSWELALANVHEKGNLVVAEMALKKMPRSLIKEAYTLLVERLQAQKAGDSYKAQAQLELIKKLPPEVRAMCEASELLYHYNQAYQTKNNKQCDQHIKTLIKAKQRAATLTIKGEGHEEPYICPRFLAVMAHAQKTRRGVGLDELCVKWIEAFRCGALDVGPLISLIPKDYLCSRAFRSSKYGNQWLNGCGRYIDAALLSDMNRQVTEAFAAKKQEFQIYCEIANAFRGEPSIAPSFAFMAELFRPLQEDERLPSQLHFMGSGALLDWPVGLVNRGKAYEQGAYGCPQDSAQAIAFYERAAHAQPFEGEGRKPWHQGIRAHDEHAITIAWYNLGVLYEKTEPEKAIDCMQKAIDRGENSADAFATLGRALVAVNRWKEAIEPLKNAALQGYLDGYTYLAHIFSTGNEEVPQDPEKALSYLKKVINLKPALATIESLLLCLHDHPRLYSKENRAFVQNHLLNLRPAQKKDRVKRFLLLSALADLTRDSEEAEEIKWLQEAYKLDQKGVAGHLAQAYENAGDAEKALQHYRESIQKNDDAFFSQNTGVLNNCGVLLMRQAEKQSKEDACDHIKEAISCFKRVIAYNHAHTTSLAKLNMAVLFLQGRCAAPEMDEAKTLRYLAESGDVEAYYELGRIYYLGHLGVEQDIHKAKEMMERSVGHNCPMDAKMNLAKLLWHVEAVRDYPRALQLFEESQGERPKDADAALSLAAAYLRTDDLAKEKVDKISELLAVGQPCDPSYTTYLKGKSYWQGKGVAQDWLQGADLLRQGILDLKKENRDEEVAYLDDIADLLFKGHDSNDEAVRAACLKSARDILIEETGSLEQIKPLEGAKALAYLYRSLLESDYKSKVEWVTRAIENDVKGAQEVLNGLLKRQHTQGAQNVAAQEKAPVTLEIAAKERETQTVLDILSKRRPKWESGLQAFENYIKQKGGTVMRGSGSRRSFRVGQNILKMHDVHGREGGNAQMDPKRQKEMLAFVEKVEASDAPSASSDDESKRSSSP
ncbi:MAG: hypothetical protein V6Z78_02925 [Holosporaceae bacterium]